jgi:phage gp46-like protein
MNFEIICVNGLPQMTWNQAKDIRTNIWLSLNINKGSFFADREFGCELYKIKKVTTGNLELAKQYIESALNWLLLVGRAVSIIVTVERDTKNFNQMDIEVSATQPDGLLIVYKEFRPVGLGTRYDYSYLNGVLQQLGTA